MAGLSVISGSTAEAEEAVQEALVRAWERSERGESFDSLDAWVAVVAANILRDRFRRLRSEWRARRRLSAGAPERSSRVGAIDARLDVVRALRALPPRQRDAIVLRYFIDLGVGEVAKAMRMNEQLTNSRYEAALKAVLDTELRQVVEKNRQDESRHLRYIESCLENEPWKKAGASRSTSA